MAKVDVQYHALANAILDTGYEYTTENRPNVPCRQLTSVNLELPLTEFPLLTTKKMFTKGIVEELLWFLRGDTKASSLAKKGVTIWNKDALTYHKKKHPMYKGDEKGFQVDLENDLLWGDVGRNYGVQWRDWTNIQGTKIGYIPSNVDQIIELLHNLRKSNPISRRHIVTAWNPSELDQTALPPCHWAFEVLPRPLSYSQRIEYSGKDQEYLNALWLEGFGKNKDEEAKATLLEELVHVPLYGFTLKWHQRSVDTFLGLPFNIASYALQSYIIGSIVDMIPMSIIGDLSNVHFYQPHIEVVREQLSNNPHAFSGCQLSFSEHYLEHLKEYKEGRQTFDEFISRLTHEDFIFENYQSFPPLKADMFAPTE